MSVIVKNLTYIYDEGMPFASKAIDDISFEIKDNDFVGLIGHTGSGKSTLIQHLNGLLKPTEGKIIVDGIDITDKKVKLTNIRKNIGLVFQYPEYQMFEETIEKDIEFGPRNLGLSEEEITRRVKRAMKMVDLDYDTYKDKSPFDLSGVQKRRVAIAGVIAMEPNVLILYEPIAGLDPKGRDDILNQIRKLHDDYKITTIMISHSMEDVAKVADRVVVMNHGSIVLDGKVSDVFKEVDVLEDIGLGVPQVTYLLRELRKKGFDISDDIYTIKDAKKAILEYLNKN